MTFAVIQHRALDLAGGALLQNVDIRVRMEVPGLPLVQLYVDKDGDTTLGNPTTGGYFSDGKIRAYCVGGFYRIELLISGEVVDTFYDVPIGLNSGSDSIASRTQRIITAAGTDTISTSDADDIIFDKTVAAASRSVMPLSSAVTKSIKVVDGKFDAATNNITVVPKRLNTFTVTIASPGVFTKVAHGLALDGPVSLETTGALPTGLLPDTQYYVKTMPTADTFTLSATPGGSVINTTGSQSGVHTYGTDTIMGGASYVIDSNGASIQLSPRSGKGWY